METVMRVLGEKIAQLESDLRYERLCSENAKADVAKLTQENEELRHKIEAAQDYVDEWRTKNGDCEA